MSAKVAARYADGPRQPAAALRTAALLALTISAVVCPAAAGQGLDASARPASAAASADTARLPRGGGAAGADTTDLARLVWAAGTLQRLLGERDYATMLLLGVAAGDWPAGTDVASELSTLVTHVGVEAADLDACRRAADVVDGTLCALERLRTFAPVALMPALAAEATSLVSPALRGAAAHSFDPARPLSFAREDVLQRYLEQRLESLWPVSTHAAAAIPTGEATLEPPTAAVRALEPWLRARLGHAPGDDAAAVLAATPSLAALLRAFPLLGDTGAGGGDVPPTAAVAATYHSFFGSLVDSAHVAVRRFGELTGAGAPSAGAAVADRTAWAARRSLVYLASRSLAPAVGLPDGGATSLAALGNAAADLHRGLADLPGTVLTAGRSVAAFALTGNVLGMASGLTSLLNLAGVGHGSAAVEVRALRGVVDSLRQHVDGRFDHLDAAVDSVLAALSVGFQRLELAVASSGEAQRREIAAVHAQLSSLGQRFDRLETNVQRYLEAGFDRDHARTLSRCLEYRQRFTPPHDRMDFATFSDCLVDFRTRGVRDARDALLTDHTTPPGDDAAVIAALADTSLHNLSRRLPLLARAAAERYGQGGAPPQLANLLEWSVAAEAYVRMLDDWPELAAAVTTADLDALIATGEELDRWSRRLTTDAAGRARSDLFAAVTREYAVAATELRSVVEAFAQRHQEQRLQRIPRDALGRALVAHEADGVMLEAPRMLLDRVPADAIAVAMLGLQPLELRYRVVLRDSTVRENFSRGFLRATRHDRHHFVIPALRVDALLGADTVAAFRLDGAPILQRSDRMVGGEASERIRSTVELVADPAGHFLVEQWPQLARDGAWMTLAEMRADRARLRATVGAELERYAAQTLDGLVHSVCLAQAPPAGATVAGEAERIRTTLQRMTAARTLFGAFLNTALSRTAAIDPAAAALLAGPDALLDQAALCRLVAAGEGALRLLWLDDAPGRAAARAAAFVAARFHDEAALPEPIQLVAATLERLHAARRIQHVRASLRP